MPIQPPNQEDRNILLTDRDEVLERFRTIDREGRGARIRGEDLPCFRGAFEHLQGVAITDTRTVLTANTSYAVGGPTGGDYDCYFLETLPADDPLRHMGGIQTIGNWFVVPVENQDQSEIRFFKFDGGGTPRIKNRLTIVRNNAKAGSVGITNYLDGNDFRYLLAVCPNGEEIHFYRTDENLSLSDLSLSNHPHPFGNGDQPFRTCQQPNGHVWRDYTNAISLLAAEDGTLYLIGFAEKNWKNVAELYQVNLYDDGVELDKIGQFKATDTDPTSFRYGASAFVTARHHIRLSTCEHRVQNPYRGTRYARLGIYSSEDRRVA